MIINKETKAILTRSDKPNENWTNTDCYVVDDRSELASKILNNYPNIEYIIQNDKIVQANIITPHTAPPTHEDVNAMVVQKIREKYDINEEFKMINLGISNPNDENYVAYRTYVHECIMWGDALEVGGGD